MAGRVVGEVESGRERISIKSSTEVSQIADARLPLAGCRWQIAADRPQQTEYRVTVIGILKRPLNQAGSSNPVTKTVDVSDRNKIAN